MILLDRASKVKLFIWSFISRGRFSIIWRISLGTVEEGSEDYTPKKSIEDCPITIFFSESIISWDFTNIEKEINRRGCKKIMGTG